MNPLDNRFNDSYVESDTVVFYDKVNKMFIKSVDEENNVQEYTSNLDKALYMPNTINFKNSSKYTSLIQQENIEPLNKIVNKITEVTLQGL